MATKLLVFTSPREGREDEYNKWYDEVHLPDLLTVPGLVAAMRYRISQPAEAPAPAHRYLAIYDVDGDVRAVLAEMRARSADGRHTISDSLDTENTSLTVWEQQ
jgi:hypothetical protein